MGLYATYLQNVYYDWFMHGVELSALRTVAGLSPNRGSRVGAASAKVMIRKEVTMMPRKAPAAANMILRRFAVPPWSD